MSAAYAEIKFIDGESDRESNVESHIWNANQVSSHVIAIEFDRTKIIGALVNENGRVVEEREIDMPQRTTRAAAAEMTKMIVTLAVSKSRAGSVINALSFSVDGIVDPPTGRVSISGMKNWTRVALLQMVEEGLKGAGIDIRISPDEKRARAKLSESPHPAMLINSRAATMAAGEAWAGAARGKKNVVYLSIDESIEAGIIVDWRVVHGAGGFAGAAGWLALSEGFKREFESRGCLTTEAGGAALKRRVIEGWDGNAKSLIGNMIKDGHGPA